MAIRRIPTHSNHLQPFAFDRLAQQHRQQVDSTPDHHYYSHLASFADSKLTNLLTAPNFRQLPQVAAKMRVEK